MGGRQGVRDGGMDRGGGGGGREGEKERGWEGRRGGGSKAGSVGEKQGGKQTGGHRGREDRDRTGGRARTMVDVAGIERRSDGHFEPRAGGETEKGIRHGGM